MLASAARSSFFSSTSLLNCYARPSSTLTDLRVSELLERYKARFLPGTVTDEMLLPSVKLHVKIQQLDRNIRRSHPIDPSRVSLYAPDSNGASMIAKCLDAKNLNMTEYLIKQGWSDDEEKRFDSKRSFEIALDEACKAHGAEVFCIKLFRSIANATSFPQSSSRLGISQSEVFAEAVTAKRLDTRKIVLLIEAGFPITKLVESAIETAVFTDDQPLSIFTYISKKKRDPEAGTTLAISLLKK